MAPNGRGPADAAPAFIFAGESDPGRRRTVNEDRFVSMAVRLPGGDATLLAVADGMGGAAGGETASRHAIAELVRALGQATPGRSDGELLADGVAAANRAVFEHARADPNLHGMGTTLVAALIRGGQAVVAHVGDSRAYLVRNGTPFRLTADHSWVAEQVRMGDLTEQEAEESNLRNVLMKSIGVQPGVAAEVSEPLALQPGDAIVLCSDGLHGLVDDVTIASAVRDVEPGIAVRRLIDLANHRGAPDNVTVVVGTYGVQALNPDPASSRRNQLNGGRARLVSTDDPPESRPRRRTRLLAASIGSAAVLGVGMLGAALTLTNRTNLDTNPEALGAAMRSSDQTALDNALRATSVPQPVAPVTDRCAAS